MNAQPSEHPGSQDSDAPNSRSWGERGLTRVPFWVYTDEATFEQEMKKVFEGPSWNFVALAAELPEPRMVKSAWIGRTPVLVTRDVNGEFHVVENRCAHRGAQLCHTPFTKTNNIECPYHKWTYDLSGKLIGIPMRKGVAGAGGLDPDFDPLQHGLKRLKVHERHGAIFASFDPEVEPFETYMGTKMLGYFDRVFDGRALTVLGDMHQRIPANWKLMVENIKDPYHAATLHVFLVTFGLFRADNPSATEMDDTGRHSVLVNERRPPTDNEASGTSYRPDLELKGPQLLDVVREFPGKATLVMQTIWPSLIVQQQSNTVAVRTIVPRGPAEFDLHWTFFGYESDDEAMTQRRLMQANLMGPSGYVSLDDGEVLDLLQRGVTSRPDSEAVMEMGGSGTDDADHAVTEVAVRAFYSHYRKVMGL